MNVTSTIEAISMMMSLQAVFHACLLMYIIDVPRSGLVVTMVDMREESLIVLVVSAGYSSSLLWTG